MARRLHSSTLGGSRKWAALESDSHRMLYERVIDITDAYGRFDADPVMVKAQAIPRLTTSIDEVEAALDDMERVGLIERWEVDGNPYAYIVAFEKFNNLDPAKEAQTTIPGPDGVIPKRPDRKDRKKTKATPKRAQGKPVASATPEPDTTGAEPGQEVGTPRAGDGPPYLYGYGYEDDKNNNPPTPLAEPEATAAPPTETPLPPKGGSGAKAPRSSRKGKGRSKKQHEFNPHDPELGLPDNFDKELFADFCDRLLEINKPMTLLALRHFVEAHKHHPPETLDEMFRRSIRAGWPDLYPIERTRASPNDQAAVDAWEQILAGARNNAMPQLDERARTALRTIGGWQAVAYGDERGLGLLRKRYLDAYRETTKDPATAT